jgi:hypothetical protein
MFSTSERSCESSISDLLTMSMYCVSVLLISALYDFRTSIYRVMNRTVRPARQRRGWKQHMRTVLFEESCSCWSLIFTSSRSCSSCLISFWAVETSKSSIARFFFRSLSSVTQGETNQDTGIRGGRCITQRTVHKESVMLIHLGDWDAGVVPLLYESVDASLQCACG